MKPPITTYALLISWGLSLVVAGCGSDEGSGGPTEEPLEPALQAAVDITIIPTAEAFATDTTTLATEAEAFCDAPSETALITLQDRWLTMVADWNEAVVYNIGPLDDDVIEPSMNFIESMRPRGTDYTDTVRATIQSAIDGDDTLDAEFFAGLTFNRVGILALEVLLFEDSPASTSTATADVLQGYEDEPRKCEVLLGMADLLAARAEGVESGWTEDFNETGVPYRDLLLTGMLEDGSSPVPAVINATWQHLEYIRIRKLSGVLDVQIASAARPEENPFWVNLARGLDTVEDLMDPPDAEASFFRVMESRGFQANADAVRQSIVEARATVDAQDREAAAAAFLDLETRFRREVPEGLGVRLGFGFSDGD